MWEREKKARDGEEGEKTEGREMEKKAKRERERKMRGFERNRGNEDTFLGKERPFLVPIAT